jgi:hypothetical protein
MSVDPRDPRRAHEADEHQAPFGDVPDPFADAGPLPPLPPELAAALRAPTPTRARLRIERLAAIVVALVAQAIALATLGLRRDLGAGTMLAWSLGAIGPALAVAIAIGAGTRRGRPHRAALGLDARSTGIAAAMAAVVFVLSVVANAALAGAWREPGMRADLVCAALAAAFAAAPIALAALAFRHAFATSAGARTAALGIAGGALAALTSHLHCPIDAPLHAIFGHGFAIAIGAAIGAGLGRITRA